MGWEPVKCLIPQRLRRLKKSQRWLADKVGQSEQQLSNYIRMTRIPGISVAKSYAEALECSIDDLYTWRYVEGQASDE